MTKRERKRLTMYLDEVERCMESIPLGLAPSSTSPEWAHIVYERAIVIRELARHDDGFDWSPKREARS